MTSLSYMITQVQDQLEYNRKYNKDLLSEPFFIRISIHYFTNKEYRERLVNELISYMNRKMFLHVIGEPDWDPNCPSEFVILAEYHQSKPITPPPTPSPATTPSPAPTPTPSPALPVPSPGINHKAQE